MSLEIKVTIDATPALLAALSALVGGGSLTAPSTNGAVKQMPKPVPAADKAAAATGQEIKVEDLRKLVKSTADQGADKKAAVLELLTEFGVKSVSTLPAERYAEFHEKIKAV